jgi:signal transduction histidine kinase
MAVSDTGTGIRDEDRPHIFEPFFSTKPAGRGTGLGLSVVRNIIYSHGGQISFQTRPGSGTTFVVTLPINHLISP